MAGAILHLKPVNFTRPSVEIHPYVQGRLRGLARHDNPAGILLGTAKDGVIHVTGFRRAPLDALLQTALEAGPAIVGFYRLQATAVQALGPEEEALWQQAQPDGNGVFLLVGTDGEAAAWIRDESGRPVVQRVSLNGNAASSMPKVPPPVLRVRMPRPTAPRSALLAGALALAVAVVTLRAQLLPPVPATQLSIEVHSRNGQLVAAWEQRHAPVAPLQSAALLILDGDKQQTIDLTPTYAPSGSATVQPNSRDVVLTLTVQYAGVPRLSRSATYVGFVPTAERPVARPAADPELAVLRKRNRELQEAVEALRKHVLP